MYCEICRYNGYVECVRPEAHFGAGDVAPEPYDPRTGAVERPSAAGGSTFTSKHWGFGAAVDAEPWDAVEKQAEQQREAAAE